MPIRVGVPRVPRVRPSDVAIRFARMIQERRAAPAGKLAHFSIWPPVSFSFSLCALGGINFECFASGEAISCPLWATERGGITLYPFFLFHLCSARILMRLQCRFE